MPGRGGGPRGRAYSGMGCALIAAVAAVALGVAVVMALCLMSLGGAADEIAAPSGAAAAPAGDLAIDVPTSGRCTMRGCRRRPT